MSADFWAGYISGAVGILIGNPLDVLKVRLQARDAPSAAASVRGSRSALIVAGTAAPVLGYGALNALLFVSYNRSEAFLGRSLGLAPNNLWTTWFAGAFGGLATWFVSTPTELVKCRAQLAISSSSVAVSSVASPTSSLDITRQIIRTSGVRGLYFGGTVTALRDSIGYGFYFWSYELSGRYFQRWFPSSSNTNEAAAPSKVLLCGGLAGIATWASVFPLDVIKTRVQTQALSWAGSGTTSENIKRPMGAMEMTRAAYREGGALVFFRGLGICSVRAFIVNAVQWAVYERLMLELGQSKKEHSVGTQVPFRESKDIDR